MNSENFVNGKGFFSKYVYEQWDEAKLHLGRLASGSQRQLIFRGQRDALWSLQTGIERSVKPQFHSTRLENSMLADFQRGYSAYVLREPKSFIERLEIMQHYGAPTRLLDFTFSPYIAAFFAFEEKFDQYENCVTCKHRKTSDYASIWAINHGYISTLNVSLLEGIKNLLQISGPHLSHFKNYNDINDIFKSGRVAVLPIYPAAMDARMIAQQSFFLIPTAIDAPFEECLNPYFEGLSPTMEFPICTRIDILKKERARILSDLDLMNINSCSLFPGLEGFARSIKWRLESDALGDELVKR